MSNLIKALQIFLKYGDLENPTHCEHDVMLISAISPQDVSSEDIAELDALGFFVGVANQFMSYRYGGS